MKPLRYLFVRSYELNIRRREVMPWLRALAIVSLLTGLNAFVLLLVTCELWGDARSLYQHESSLRLMAFASIAFTFVLFYFHWITSGRYLRFKKEFASESPVQRKFRTVLLFIYGIASLLGPAALGYWSHLQRVGMLSD